ncbi:MAG TPA: type II toxin-antitoxin system HipA family toxin [Dyella sp.]|uniref:type II toxin-antitoxin system HipA family toxin n=1 Tax=Dyella sp. TaxID=1869338 RepID=UPI002F93FFF8
MTNKAIRHLAVSTPQGNSGVLAHEDGYFFQYAPDISPAAEIALTMQRRLEPYRSHTLLPIFEMNLPEGYVLEELRNRFAKTAQFDPMLLLALTGHQAAVGRVSVHSPDAPDGHGDRGVRLETILAWNGAEDLFQELSERYLTRTGMSGIQPKVLVPEDVSGSVYGKASVATSDLIVKRAGEKFPGLALNEFICMSIAREAGVPVPEFYLSENRKLFVMRRFDRTSAGEAIGFEDMASLMGRSAQEKYTGSYAQIAHAIEAYCAPEHVGRSKAQLFDQVVLSAMLGNGDAHLKNFGLLYTHPLAGDVRMAPAYDIVNTTRYIPEDQLALALNGSRSLFLARTEILPFAKVCGISDPAERLGQLIHAAEVIMFTQQDLLDDETELRDAIRQGIDLFTKTYERA